MSQRRPRRAEARPRLAELGRAELLEVSFFGLLAGGVAPIEFSREDSALAWQLYRSRHGAPPISRWSPDPRPVLSGRAEDREAVRLATERWEQDRDELIRASADQKAPRGPQPGERE